MSTRITGQMLTTSLLADLNTITDKMAQTQERLSSGKQILEPSDDPFGTARALSYRDELAQNTQYQTNINNATSWQDATDTALGDIGDLVQRARDLVVQGATDSTGDNGRQADADEIDQIIESIKAAGNTQYAGRYIFSGTATNTAPYTANGADTYNGDTGSITAEIGPSTQVQINVNGQSVIGDGTSGLLATLRSVSADLRSGNTTALQTTDLDALTTENDNVTEARATVGAREDRLSSALSRLQQLQESTTSLLSNTEDADMAQTITDLTQEQTVYQAALKAGADIVQPSLMDFLS